MLLNDFADKILLEAMMQLIAPIDVDEMPDAQILYAAHHG